MNLKNIFKTAFLVDLFQGMAITFRQMMSGAITEQYPRQRSHVDERFRGEPRLATDENGKTLCVACNMCAQVCPEKCITIGREKNPETKKFELTTYIFDMRRCMFCGFCEEVCPTDCILLTPDYEMAQYEIKNLVLDRPALEKGMAKTPYKR